MIHFSKKKFSAPQVVQVYSETSGDFREKVLQTQMQIS
jgi:hypothetical protein